MINGLNGEQSTHAEQLLSLMEERQQFFLNTVERFNGSRETETRVFDEDKALHEVSVARGEVIEKAGWYTNRMKKADPPYVPEMLWASISKWISIRELRCLDSCMPRFISPI